ncbi:MAG: cyclic 2,3-diphosphoglycerate synthase [Brooklawnia sp.]|jgi:predicted GTPase
MAAAKKLVIVGAAGRDFHNFNVCYRDNPEYEVVAFTAAQIPDIAGRSYPPELAGSLYPNGIPIHEESELTELIKTHNIDQAVFSYSDLPYAAVMHLAAEAIAAGADFVLPSAAHTMLPSTKPVIAITAVRTGAGKSQTTRYISKILNDLGKKVVAVRHPMPYGDLAQQAVQRFADYSDLDKHNCTIEEREEYEPHIDHGFIMYAGVDYERILRQAEQEADIILWDGGNNDMSFFSPDLNIVIADPLRAGDETNYHPGEVNMRLADVIIINKCDSATPEQVAAVQRAAEELNPSAQILLADSPVTVDDPAAIEGKKVVVIEDGPTLTHGSMSFGAGVVGAQAAGVAEIVDPAPFAVDSIAGTYDKYPNARGILPAMGYSAAQVSDLEATIEAMPVDAVVAGTPIDITRVLEVSKPLVRARYELRPHDQGRLESIVSEFIGG